MGMPDTHIADLYRAADVLLSPSMGEGFGLPIAEAQACGCPVITQDCSSMSELTINGIAIEPGPRHWTALGNWWHKPLVGHVTARSMRFTAVPTKKSAWARQQALPFH